MQQFQLQKQAKLLLNKSQSLIEFFISFYIFVIAFVSLIILVNNYLNTLKISKERVIANFLAQEGLELVIAKRNIERVNKTDFSNIFSNGDYCIDFNLQMNITNSPCPLYIDNNGFYTHNSSNASSTIFKRLVKINKVSDGNTEYVFVTSTVEFYNQKVELTTILTPWF